MGAAGAATACGAGGTGDLRRVPGRIGGPAARDRPPPAGRSTARARRAARALAAAGAVCLLGGVTLLAAPLPVAVPIEPEPPPMSGAARRLPVVEVGLARLFAGETPAPPPVRAGTAPVELALPARGVRAPVVAVATGPAGALLVPDPPSTVGWWSPSALAGSATGTTVLAGHVDSAAGGLGALAVLRQVAAGEEVALRGADGRVVGYRVTARRQYAKAELPPEVFTAGGPPRLVLITCGGAFDRRARHYADNVVVFAEPV